MVPHHNSNVCCEFSNPSVFNEPIYNLFHHQVDDHLDEIIDKMEISNDFSQSYDDEINLNTDWKTLIVINYWEITDLYKSNYQWYGIITTNTRPE